MRTCDCCPSRRRAVPTRIGLFARDEEAPRSDRREWELLDHGWEWDLCPDCRAQLLALVQASVAAFVGRGAATPASDDRELTATLGFGETAGPAIEPEPAAAAAEVAPSPTAKRTAGKTGHNKTRPRGIARAVRKGTV